MLPCRPCWMDLDWVLYAGQYSGLFRLGRAVTEIDPAGDAQSTGFVKVDAFTKEFRVEVVKTYSPTRLRIRFSGCLCFEGGEHGFCDEFISGIVLYIQIGFLGVPVFNRRSWSLVYSTQTPYIQSIDAIYMVAGIPALQLPAPRPRPASPPPGRQRPRPAKRSLIAATPGSSPLSMRLGLWSGWVGKPEELRSQRKALRNRIPTRIEEKEERKEEVRILRKTVPTADCGILRR